MHVNAHLGYCCLLGYLALFLGTVMICHEYMKLFRSLWIRPTISCAAMAMQVLYHIPVRKSCITICITWLHRIHEQTCKFDGLHPWGLSQHRPRSDANDGHCRCLPVHVDAFTCSDFTHRKSVSNITQESFLGPQVRTLSHYRILVPCCQSGGHFTWQSVAKSKN